MTLNHILARATKGQPDPEVGMGATLLYWSDRHAATVTGYDEVKQIITVQEDHAKRIDKRGMCESQDYEYTRNPDGQFYNFQWCKKKLRWRQVRMNPETGRWNKINGIDLQIGYRNEYYDFSL